MRTKYFILALIGLILATFFLGRYSYRQKAESALNDIYVALNDTVEHFKYRIDTTAFYASRISQIVVSQKEAIRNLEITKEELRKLNLKKANELTKLKLQVDTLLTNISSTGNIMVVYDTIIAPDSINVIRLPFTFEQKDEWLDLFGAFNHKGELGINLKMDVPVDLWTGIDKKTKQPIAILTTPNKYIQTINITSLKMDMPKPKKYGIGLQFGYGVIFGDPIKTAPYFGVGLSRNLIRF